MPQYFKAWTYFATVLYQHLRFSWLYHYSQTFLDIISNICKPTMNDLLSFTTKLEANSICYKLNILKPYICVKLQMIRKCVIIFFHLSIFGCMESIWPPDLDLGINFELIFYDFHDNIFILHKTLDTTNQTFSTEVMLKMRFLTVSLN